jgi:hypothetical protein
VRVQLETETPSHSEPVASNLVSLAGWVVAALLAASLALYYGKASHNSTTVFSTPYQAVLLSNGAVYYGKLQGYGSANPVLSDVFYIVSQTNPETKQTSNVLVKRGKELHAPDRMYLNALQVVFVEPVGIGSKVSQLIGEAAR